MSGNIYDGIRINGKHTFNDFGAILATRKADYPEIERVTATVPYSNVVHDFSALYGDITYSQREIMYRFKFIGDLAAMMCDKLASFFFSIGASAVDIYDDEMGSEYHWHGVLKSVSQQDTVGEQFGARMLEVHFLCDFQRIPNNPDYYEPDVTRWPDVDGNGSVTAGDASDILVAVTKIGTGEPSGLTPEQELRADADRDGQLTAVDASLVQQYLTEVGVGRYANTPDGWAKYMNVITGRDAKEI